MRTHPKLRIIAHPDALIFLLLLLALGPAAPVARAAGELPIRPATPVRLDGYLVMKQAAGWMVGHTAVMVDAATTVDETAGSAIVGAYVTVWGSAETDGVVRASFVQVVRPAGANGPVVEMSGVVQKIRTMRDADGRDVQFWIVDKQLVLAMEPETVITGGAAVGMLVWVVAFRSDNELHALAIQGITDDPGQLPVEFEGEIASIGADVWGVDGQTVRVSPSTLVLGAPHPGATAEVRGVSLADGAIEAQVIRVVDETGEASVGAFIESIEKQAEGEVWNVAMFTGSGDDLHVVRGTVAIAPGTYIEERRGVKSAAMYADIDGNRISETEVAADVVRLDRPIPVTVAGRFSLVNDTREGALWSVGGTRVWSQPGSARQALTAARAANQMVKVRGLRLGNGVIWVQQIEPAGPQGR